MSEQRDCRSILITGASSDIGVALTTALLAGPAQVGEVEVGLIGRSLPRLKQRLAGVDIQRVHLFECDIRDRDAVERVAGEVVAKMPALDGLAHLAGLWHNGASRFQGPPLIETPAPRIDEVLDVTVRAPLHLLRTLIPSLARSGRGKAVIMSCGFAGPHEARGWVDYYVANMAVRALVAGVAAEVRDSEMQVNAVAPWFVATEPVKRFYPERVDEALDPRDVAATIKFLLSGAADGISGQVIELRSKRDHGSDSG